MSTIYRRSCGMDVHKGMIVVCVMPPVGSGGQIIRKTYGTFRNELIRMRVWLKQLKVTEIAMESTGVYWRSVWNVHCGSDDCRAGFPGDSKLEGEG